MTPDLTPERWARVDRIFEEALERGPGERGSFVERASGEDGEIRDAVLRLLEAHEAAGGFLEGSGPLAGGEALAEILEGAPTVPSLVGRDLGPYRVIERIGHGGMGTVFLAERSDGRFEARVALKLLHAGLASEDLLERFRTERRILAALGHPNIARIMDAGETEEGWPYLVMEYIRGEPITHYADRRRLTVRERVDLFLQVCRAVEHAHGRMVVHRDLKPSNVMVTAEGEVKLLDFGIAKLLDRQDGAGTADRTPTRTGVRLLTPEYAAPEQLRGEEITAATDVYQLGVLLYRLLVGRRPYGDPSPSRELSAVGALERAILTREPARASDAALRSTPERDAGEEAASRRTDPGGLRKSLRGDLDAILLTALQKEPGRRYSSVRGLSEDLDRYTAGLPVRARAPTPLYRARKFAGRHRWWLVAAGVAALAVGEHLRTQAAYQGQLQEERDRAVAEERKARETADFLVSLFQEVDPAQERGDTLSALTLVDRGTERIRETLADDPVLRATLLAAVGRAHLGLGTGRQAWDLLEEARTLLALHEGRDGPEYLRVVEDLAMEFHRAHQFRQAERHWRELLAHRRRAWEEKPDEPDGGIALARAKMGLARTLRDLNRPQDAVALAEASLALRREHHEPESDQVARTLSHLAYVLRGAGDLDRAEELYLEALETLRAVDPPNGSAVAGALNNLAFLHVQRGAYEDAVELYQEGVEVSRSVFGDTHDRTFLTQHNLASAFERAGAPERGVEIYAEVMAAKEARFGSTHWRVGRTYGRLGGVLWRAGEDPERAVEYHRRSLAIYEEALGPEHAWTAGARNQLAETLLARGSLEEAEGQLEAARSAMASSEAERAPVHLERALELLVDLHSARGDQDAAGEFAEALLRHRTTSGGERAELPDGS